MLPNRNLQLHTTLQLEVGSPPPTFACPHCSRYLYSKIGRTKHIKIKHSQVANAIGPDPQTFLPPSPASVPSSSHSESSSHNLQFDRPPSPIPLSSDSSPPPHSPIDVQVDASDNFGDISLVDADSQLDQDPGDRLSEDRLPSEGHIPNPPDIARIHHPKLNGK